MDKLKNDKSTERQRNARFNTQNTERGKNVTKEESLRLEKILTKIDKAGEADYGKQEEYNRFCMNTREDWNEEQYQTLRREKTLTEVAYLASLVELKAEVKSMLTQ